MRSGTPDVGRAIFFAAGEIFCGAIIFWMSVFRRRRFVICGLLFATGVFFVGGLFFFSSRRTVFFILEALFVQLAVAKHF